MALSDAERDELLKILAEWVEAQMTEAAARQVVAGVSENAEWTPVNPADPTVTPADPPSRATAAGATERALRLRSFIEKL